MALQFHTMRYDDLDAPFPSRGAISIGPHDRPSRPIAVAVAGVGRERKSYEAISAGFRSQGRAKLRVFSKTILQKSMQLSPSLTTKPILNLVMQLMQSMVLILLDHPVLSPPFSRDHSQIPVVFVHPTSQPVTLHRRIIIVQSGLEEKGAGEGVTIIRKRCRQGRKAAPYPDHH